MTRERHDDPELLKRAYEETGSIRKAAERFDCCYKTVHNRMDKHDIDRSTPNKERPPYRRKNNFGYWMWEHYDGERYQTVVEHRLLAVAKFGFERVAGMEVHHKNGFKFDNRVENLELLSKSDHAELHVSEREKDENNQKFQ